MAKLAGVSLACVSKYINNKPYVSKKTKLKIAKAIDDLDFKPSAIARSLVRKRTNNIGLIVLDITNPFHTQVIRGMEEYINENNLKYNLILEDIIDKKELGDKNIDSFIENRVAGILSTTDQISIKYLNYLKNIKLPIVFIGRFVDSIDIKVDYVTTNNFKGAYLMTDYLLKLGHENIGYITGPLDSRVVINRFNGYKKALKDSKMKVEERNIVIADDLTSENGFMAAKELLSSRSKLTAIFCVSDFMAFGVIDYCYKNNIKIPDDISITGFDDVSFSSLNFINLTTVRQPIKKIGKKAMEIITKKIENEITENVEIAYDVEVIKRNSTRSL